MVNSKSKKKTLTALSNKGLGVFGEVLNTLHSVADTVNKVVLVQNLKQMHIN